MRCRGRFLVLMLLVVSFTLLLHGTIALGGGKLIFPKWIPIGPAPISGGQTYDSNDARVDVTGRVSVLAVNPYNPSQIFLGAACGGVWLSFDAGGSWTPVADDEASLAIGAIALDECDSKECKTIYVGTGENNIRRDTYYGAGLLVHHKPETYGSRWEWELRGHEYFNLASINNIVLDPTTWGETKRMYVTLSSGVTASASESTVTAPEPPLGYGIYMTEDEGLTWEKLVVPGTDGTKPTDLEMAPHDSNVLYAGFMGKGIFKGVRDPSDGTISWCPLNPGSELTPQCDAIDDLPNPNQAPFDHVEISLHQPTPQQPLILYAIFGSCTHPILHSCSSGLYKSGDGGATWALMNDSCPWSYSRYTHVLTIQPEDPSTVYYGGLRLYKSTNSGVTFSEIGTDTLHPDHQAVVFANPKGCSSNALKCAHMYDASDGGFAISYDSGDTWESSNGTMQLTGFQSISASIRIDKIIGGSQDNGTNMWLGTDEWQHIDDGDSGSTIMDRFSGEVMYDLYYYATPRRSKSGGGLGTWKWIKDGLDGNDPAAFYPPMVQDPTFLPGQPYDVSPPYHPLYIGTNRLYHSHLPPGGNTMDWRPGDSWRTASPVLGGTVEFFEDIQTTNVITAIAVAPSDRNRIYLGYYGGQIFVTDGFCTNPSCWYDVDETASGLPETVVTWLAAHPTDPDTAYATFSGFNLPGCAHVYKTTDGGVTWDAASGPHPCDPDDHYSLPDIPTNTIHLEWNEPDNIWLGTDKGVYKSHDGAQTWVDFNGTGHWALPNVPVYDIAVDEVWDRVILGTHGRGAYLYSVGEFPQEHIYEVACKPPCFLDIFLVINSVINPAEDPISIRMMSLDGSPIVEDRTDAAGGSFAIDAKGQLVTSRSGLYDRRPGAWLTFDGKTLGGVDTRTLDSTKRFVSSFAVQLGDTVVRRELRGTENRVDPPSTTLTVVGFEKSMESAKEERPARRAKSGKTKSVTRRRGYFNLNAMVQDEAGTPRSLCSVRVPLRAVEDEELFMAQVRDALNDNRQCAEHSLSAEIRGTRWENQKEMEDRPPGFIPRLTLSAPELEGVQLVTAMDVSPGGADGLCFEMDQIGMPIDNKLMPMKLRFRTPARGAKGGDITLVERSLLGTCAITVPIKRGASSREIASAVAEAFQAPGLPGRNRSCPAGKNPRDVVVEGNAIRTILPYKLSVCIEDPGIGLNLEPWDVSFRGSDRAE